MKNKTILMAAMLAVATVLAAGLTVLPGSIQEAQANPCATEIEEEEAGAVSPSENTDERECNFTGYFEFDEESESGDNVATENGATENGATETDATDIMPNPLFDLSDIDVIDEVN